MKRVALVYDWVDKWGGVERLLLTLHEMFPEAPLFTSLYNKNGAKWAKDIDIKASFMQQLPPFIQRNRHLSLSFFPYAFESFNFTEYDTVISVSSSFAKGVITKPHTKHLSIVLTPPRYFWDLRDTYISYDAQVFINPILEQFKKWDTIAATRPDRLISISNLVKERIKKTYNRESTVIYPPFDTVYWEDVSQNKKTPSKKLPEEYYLVVSRLERYKKVDLVINAFNEMPDKHLVVVGTGNERNSLKQSARENIHFYENISDQELATCYSHAKALIMMQEEDFGYTALESIYFSCPVITYSKSGAAEIVENNKTGLYVEEQSKKALISALERFSQVTYNVSVSKKNLSDTFGSDRFKKMLLEQLQIINLL